MTAPASLASLGAHQHMETIDGLPVTVLTFVCPICRTAYRMIHHQPVVLYHDGAPTNVTLAGVSVRVHKRVHGATLEDLSLVPPVEIAAAEGPGCPGGSALILQGAWQG